MSTNEDIVRNFIKAWSTLDVETIVAFFSDDGVYHNMPIAPVSGRAQKRFGWLDFWCPLIGDAHAVAPAALGMIERFVGPAREVGEAFVA